MISKMSTDYFFPQVGLEALRSGKSKTEVLDLLLGDRMAKLSEKFVAYQRSALVVLDTRFSLSKGFAAPK